ncbi:Glycosyltransferase involved in cell wall bisynthesis [Pelagirhabdus alkalitolerans]|uniref:Glycosyltransferase involved in cell wall bisynthesis n=1 Tax=Pelagirhabdus alkalitolerans TaxID=1612202 RepID=A0A1G6GGF0_9BACI|nr:glycosyltransferase family 4 protein [Pelagirhabdus alkalitolerans]SDB81088.1 Glycosyltransferase involved in cell wall bisynthesis [Pelagirhabdus alkalitolerans]
MRLLYAHDHKFYKFKQEYFSNGSFSTEALKRYTEIFDEVNFVSRQIDIDCRPKDMTNATAERVKFIRVPDYKSVKKYYKIIRANKLIEEEVKKADYVIARNSSIGLLSVKFAKKHNIPYLIEVVACPWDGLWNHSLKGKVIAPLEYFKLKRYVKVASHTIYVTNQFLQKRYPTQGKNISCSNVSLTKFDKEVIEKRERKIKNKNQNEKTIIGTTAAVDVKFKGQQYMIKALSELKKQGKSNYEYHLVGKGDQSYLRKIAEKYNVVNQVKFWGAMPHDEVFNWLDTIDLYAQPSKQEGLPRALIEAMSRAVPSIGAETAGIPELLEKDMIFENKFNNSSEIVEIIKSLDKKKQLEQADKNFNEAKKYRKEIIESRRNEFLKQFVIDNS